MKYGFIGCGNMGGALVAALAHKTKDIMLANRTIDKAAALADSYGLTYGTNMDVAENCDAIFLGVKPQILKEVLEPLAKILCKRRPLLISMAAGTYISDIEKMISPDCDLPIIRIMPNTAALVGRSMILYSCNDRVTDDELQAFLSDMEAAGEFDELPEKLIDAGSAIAGCGPAYVFIMLEALADGGVACGLPRDKALKYAIKTMEGSAVLAGQTGRHPEELKDMVCSPGGTTIKGVKALEDRGFRSAAMSAVMAAYEASLNLK